MSDVRDIPFDEHADPYSIRLRLHPIDMGFDARATRTAVYTADELDGSLCASYPAADGSRRVMQGEAGAVIARLRRLGFDVRLLRDL